MIRTLKIIFLFFTVSCYAQDSITPFKYLGKGKWETTTEFVKQYDIDLIKLNYYDSAFAEIEKQNLLYSSMIDTMNDQIVMYKKIIEAKDNIITNKQDYINELEKPKEIKTVVKPGISSLIDFEGLHFNLGTSYKFDNRKLTGENIINGLKYFGSLESGLLILNKFKLDLEILIPAEIRLKGGIRLW